MSKQSSPYDKSRQGLGVTDPETGLTRLCATPCHSCILHPNVDKRALASDFLTGYLDRIAEADEFVICHNTGPDLGLGDGASLAI